MLALPAIVFRLKGNSIRTAGGAFHHAVRPTSRIRVLTAVIEIFEKLVAGPIPPTALSEWPTIQPKLGYGPRFSE
jgi:hypothetical protein